MTSNDAPITMTYRNYRGEVAQRTVVPTRIWFGSTDWHPEPGWLMSAYDLEKGSDRDFALADCQFADLATPPAAPTCPECGDTGMRDTGGVHPWGEHISVPCDCATPPAAPVKVGGK
jgi:hypothetical protein